MPRAPTLKCSKCRAEKPATTEFFALDRSSARGFQTRCKACTSAARNRTGRKVEPVVTGSDGVPRKKCSACHRALPATREHFHLQRGRPVARCISCTNKLRARPAPPHAPREVDGIVKKNCTKCGTLRPATAEFFRPMKEGRLGLHPWCRKCTSEYDRTLRERIYPNRRRQTRERQSGDVVERKCTTCERWFPATPDHFTPQIGCRLGLRPTCRMCSRARSLEYAEHHSQAAVARAAKWNNANRDRHRQHVTATRNKRRMATGTFTAADIREKLAVQEYRCYYCTAQLGDDYEVDHFVPLAKGGTNDATNVVVACPSCNRRKSAKDPERFLAQMRRKMGSA